MRPGKRLEENVIRLPAAANPLDVRLTLLALRDCALTALRTVLAI